MKLIMPTWRPADVGSPRNHMAEPLKAGFVVIMGIHEVDDLVLVTTRPSAESGSALGLLVSSVSVSINKEEDPTASHKRAAANVGA